MKQAEKVWCPLYTMDIDIDICKDHQMVGDHEFVPRILADELAPGWQKRCEACPQFGRFGAEALVPPEMDHE